MAEFSKHARERMKSRGISADEVTDVIEHPDNTITQPCKTIYQKKIDRKNSLYLYRVFVNTCKDPELIITVYRTTKIDKYEN